MFNVEATYIFVKSNMTKRETYMRLFYFEAIPVCQIQYSYVFQVIHFRFTYIFHGYRVHRRTLNKVSAETGINVQFFYHYRYVELTPEIE